jgi:hypothetical protein
MNLDKRYRADVPPIIIFTPEMRIVAQVPHPQMKISIFAWNEKYIIEMEAGQYKQTYKISQDSVAGLDAVKELCTPELISGTLARFSAMHSDFHLAYQTISNPK